MPERFCFAKSGALNPASMLAAFTAAADFLLCWS